MEHTHDTTPDGCRDCAEALEHCHGTSVEHDDGTTECLGDEPCTLAHELHRWRQACADVTPDCGCRRDLAAPLPHAA